MRPHKHVLTVALALALGLGVWAASFSYRAATFTDGEVLSATALNDLLNDNFQAAADAVAERVHGDGDTMSGPLVITADAVPLSEGALPVTLGAVNPRDDGFTAIFQSNNADNEAATVGILNSGGGPALLIKSTGAGHLINANNVFEVLDTGSIRLGGPSNPKLVLDAEDGTITNAVGAGLPFAYGRVAGGNKAHGTDNWSVTWDAGNAHFLISFTDTSYSLAGGFGTVVTPTTSSARGARTDASGGGDLIVQIFNSANTAFAGNFSFITFWSPSP